MLQQIRNYLFQYKTAAIPEVGTFQVAYAPAVLDVASQELLPPSASIHFLGQHAVPAHQLQTFAGAFDANAELAGAALNQFGRAFKNGLQQEPFHWTGIGALELANDSQILFLPHTTENLLMPVPAQRVIRENVQHTVLVGDQQVTNAPEPEPVFEEAPSRSWSTIVAWVLLLIAAAFIVYYLYVHNWAPGASGLSQKPIIENSPVQHQ